MTKIQNSIKETFEKELQKENWSTIRVDYICFANSLISSKTWQGIRGGIPPGGLDGEDLVEIVFVKILEGKLSCKEGVEFVAFVKQAIRAIVINLVNTKENFNTVSNYFYSKEAMKVCSMLDFISSPEKCQYEMFPSKMFNLTVEQIISAFLRFIKHDSLLTKVAKIFLFNGAVFEECFHDLKDGNLLIKSLTVNGYVDLNGEVQNKFWVLGSSDKMRLDKDFEAHKKVIFLIIRRSTDIEKPRDIAQWLNIGINDIYYIKKKMKRYLLRFKNKMEDSNGGNYDQK
ncbi:MAG: hypothetical protein KAJ18_05655 [Candidatus Omnitrophica bacterium]|nr:hypothetical protein [Candidatus Omnitrophota bacterium]